MHTYQLLLHQPLAVAIDPAFTQPFRVYPDDSSPIVVIQPVHENNAQRLSEGGTRVAIEFDSEEDDLVRAVSEGSAVGTDLLAAVCLSSGTPLVSNLPLQIIRKGRDSSVEFLRFLSFEGLSWPRTLTETDFKRANLIQRHWRELDGGHRLRRAAYRYGRALASRDPLEAFQHAYAGLESIEKLLADELGIPAGSETETETCKWCGASYEYKRTVLAGVRAFIRGGIDIDSEDSRAKEWRALSNLRHALVHGLKDLDELRRRSRDLMPTICHYLHDASVHLAHVHELESDQFRLARFGKRLVIRGRAHLACLPSLLEQALLIEAEPMAWVEDEEHGLVPQYELRNLAGDAVEAQVFVLAGDFGDESENDLVPTRWGL